MFENWPAHSRFASLALASALGVAGIGRGWLSALGSGSSHQFNLIYGITLSFIFAYWLECDSRQTGLIRVWDRAWLFFTCWPVVLPYYLFKTRGAKRALAIILAWLGFYPLVALNAGLIAALWWE